jgi:hypothetical protein
MNNAQHLQAAARLHSSSFPLFLRMKSTSMDEPARQEERQTGLHLCEHCNLLGVSAVISADHESNEVIYCVICKLKFYFLTEGNRVLVTKVESIE